MSFVVFRSLCWCAFIFFLLSCEKSKDPILVTVGEVEIRSGAFKKEFEVMSLPEDTGLASSFIKDRLEQAIEFESLYQEALQLGYDQDFEIQKRIKTMLVNELLENRVIDFVKSQEISDEDIKVYFEKNEHLYNRPEQVKIADIFIKSKSKAIEVQKEVKALEGKRFGFGELIQTYSEKHPNYPLGNPGYIDKSGQPVGIEIEVVEEAFRLKRGEFSNLIETPKGFHVILVTAKRPAVRYSWQDKKRQIKHELYQQAVSNRKMELVEEIKGRYKSKLNHSNIDQVIKEILNNQKQPSFQQKRPPALPGR